MIREVGQVMLLLYCIAWWMLEVIFPSELLTLPFDITNFMDNS
jgi:hypothetical protein